MIPFLVLLVTVLIGGKLLEILGFRAPWYEKWSLAFLLASGSQTILYFVILRLGIPATFFTYLSFLLLLLLVVVLGSSFNLCSKTPVIKLADSSKKNYAKTITRLLWLGIFALFVVTAIYTTYLPVYTTDSLILYDFRAKVIAVTGALESIRSVPDWAVYPMFTSMIHLFARLVSYDNPSLFYPLMYLAFAGIFYSAIRVNLSQIKASLLTFLMYSTPITLWQSKLDGMTNLPYAIFYCIAVIYLGKYLKHNKPIWQYAIISAIFLGFASWTRHTEPFWIVPLFLLLVNSIFKRSLFIPAIYLFIFWYIRSIWPTYTQADYMSVVGATQSVISNATSVSSVASFGILDTLRLAIKFVWKAFDDGLSPLVQIFLLTVLMETIWLPSKRQIYYLGIVLFNIVILFLSVVFAINTFSYWDGLDNSFMRMISFLSPLIWFYLSNSHIWYRIDEWGK